MLDNPKSGGAFFSPWFGIESSDNLNLIQPVNPWTGTQWQMYIEVCISNSTSFRGLITFQQYFQWEPTHNENSNGHAVSPGDVLHGVVDFVEERQVYTISHTNMNTGWNVKVL